MSERMDFQDPYVERKDVAEALNVLSEADQNWDELSDEERYLAVHRAIEVFKD